MIWHACMHTCSDCHEFVLTVHNNHMHYITLYITVTYTIKNAYMFFQQLYICSYNRDYINSSSLIICNFLS